MTFSPLLRLPLLLDKVKLDIVTMTPPLGAYILLHKLFYSDRKHTSRYKLPYTRV